MQTIWSPTGSVSSRVLSLVIATVLVAVGTLLLVANVQSYVARRSALLGSVHGVTALFSEQAAQAALDYDTDTAQSVAEDVAAQTGATRVHVYEIDDNLLARFGPGEPGAAAPARPGAAGGRLALAWDRFAGGYETTVALRANGLPAGRIHVEVPSGAVVAPLLADLGLQLAVALLLVLLAAPLTRRGRNRLVSPIRSLLAGLETVARKQDYSVHIEPSGPDEIGRLIINFNEMVAALELRDQRLSEHRRELQEQVIQRTRKLEEIAQAAEKSSHAKGDFLARMSHEIRTPMNGVVGMAELLGNSRLDESQRRMLKTMRASADSLLEIINDILDFSKIEAEFLQILSEDFPVRDLVEEVCELLAPQAHQKGLELVVDIADGVPAWVNGDPLRIRQVITNLVGNAIKYTEQGQVVVRATLDGRDEYHCALLFEVVDTGAGIPEEELERVFEAFTQLATFESRTHGGTGLGLAITRQLVKLMGGTVGARSKLGSGSTFWFRLPLEHARRAAPPDGWSLFGVRTLVAIHNPAVGSALCATLERAGASVVEVTTAQRALERLATDPGFGLLVVDQQLPDFSGLALLEKLRADPACVSLPVLMLRGAEAQGHDRAAPACEPDAWVLKPVRLRRLQGSIDRCLQRVEALSSPADGSQSDRVHSLGLKVLLVEDSPVNTEVATGMLEALGCVVTAVHTGELGVEHALGASFDVVLMDCQMPLMDGYQATRLIRSGESHHGRQNVPIIAITANALPGDRERCLNAGMTDFISKPFTLKRLRSVLHAIAGTAAVRSPEIVEQAERTGDTSRLPVVEFGQIEELRALGRPQVVRKAILLFLKQSADLLNTIDDALRSTDLPAVEHAAHTLRSSSLSVGGSRLAATAATCETAARDGNDAAARSAAKRLRPEFSVLSSALATFVDSAGTERVA